MCINVCLNLSLSGCAAPAPDFAEQNFVPQKDVLASSLYIEGQNLLRSGRYIDAEMRFRQAEYLFPEAENIKSQLALTLKNAGLYSEALSIYQALITRNPKMIDYHFAYADALYKAGKYDNALLEFDKARLAFEAKKDLTKAANTARSQAAILFQIGKEVSALCLSNEAYEYTPIQDELLRHARLLMALGYFNQVDAILAAFVSDASILIDPKILKLAAFAKHALGELTKYKELSFRIEQLRISGVEPDLEMQVLVLLNRTNNQAESESDVDLVIPTINDGLMLYWPVTLISAWESFLASRVEG